MMKNRNIRFVFTIVIGLAAYVAFSSATCLAQTKAQPSKPPTPTVSKTPTAPERKTIEESSEAAFHAKVETLMKRVDALEAENQELKKQLSAAKFLLTGLDKGYGDFKQQVADFKAEFANHKHRLNLPALAMAFKCKIPIGDCTVVSNIDSAIFYIPPGKTSDDILFTTPPKKP
jgi:hypothetical protein